jgi:hypothetical protein
MANFHCDFPDFICSLWNELNIKVWKLLECKLTEYVEFWYILMIGYHDVVYLTTIRYKLALPTVIYV